LVLPRLSSYSQPARRKEQLPQLREASNFLIWRADENASLLETLTQVFQNRGSTRYTPDDSERLLKALTVLLIILAYLFAVASVF
jgi:hypothetical protein